ncbi:MAG: DMT family transporter [Hyphomicrobiales bacterium]
MDKLGNVFLLLGTGICWGATMPLTKTAVSTGHQPIGLIFWQLVFSSVLLSVLVLVRGRRPHLSREFLFYFLMVGLLGTLIPNSFSYLAAAQLPAGVMAISIATVPMFALVLALGFRIERFSARRLAGVGLGALAVVLLVGPEASLPDPAKAVFVLVALIAPFCYGLETIYIALKAPKGVDPVATLLGASLIGAIIAAPIAFSTGLFVDLTQPWGTPEWALLTSSVFHVVAYTSYIWLIGRAGPVFSSQIAYIVTIAGVFISSIALSETYSPWTWAALALMLGGIALVQPRRARVLEAS